jgi:hypothetical protein
MERIIEYVIRCLPGEISEMKCKVCGTVCDVKRNCKGMKSMGAAMAGMLNEHDQFTCPRSADEWHVRARKLMEEIARTPSKILARIMQDKLEELLKESLNK